MADNNFFHGRHPLSNMGRPGNFKNAKTRSWNNFYFEEGEAFHLGG